MHTSSYELIIFDWDGTLVDSLGYVVECVEKAIAETGLKSPPAADIRKHIGRSATEVLQTIFPDESKITLNQIIENYRKHFFSANEDRIRLFAGVHETLHQLHNAQYTLAIATGKGRRGLITELAATQLTSLFSASRTADDAQSKPHPQMVLELLDELQIPAHKALVIGDTTYDILMAKNAGVEAIAVTYGGHSIDELKEAEPKGYINEFASITQYLKEEVN